MGVATPVTRVGGLATRFLPVNPGRVAVGTFVAIPYYVLKYTLCSSGRSHGPCLVHTCARIARSTGCVALSIQAVKSKP